MSTFADENKYTHFTIISQRGENQSPRKKFFSPMIIINGVYL